MAYYAQIPFALALIKKAGSPEAATTLHCDGLEWAQIALAAAISPLDAHGKAQVRARGRAGRARRASHWENFATIGACNHRGLATRVEGTEGAYVATESLRKLVSKHASAKVPA